MQTTSVSKSTMVLWRTVTNRTDYSSHTVIRRSLLRFLHKRIPGYERKSLFTPFMRHETPHMAAMLPPSPPPVLPYDVYFKKVLALNASEFSNPHYDPAGGTMYHSRKQLHDIFVVENDVED